MGSNQPIVFSGQFIAWSLLKELMRSSQKQVVIWTDGSTSTAQGVSLTIASGLQKNGQHQGTKQGMPTHTG